MSTIVNPRPLAPLDQFDARSAYQQARDDRRRRTSAPSPRAHRQLAAVGHLPRRAPMGHRPRGLFGVGQLLGLFHPRPCPQPRLSLGRRRSDGHLRPRMPALLRARALERQGPDSQGAAVRTHRPRRQSRRGRQRAATTISTRRRPTRTSNHSTSIRRPSFPMLGWSTRIDAAAETIPNLNSPTPACSTTTATSTSRPNTPRARRTTCSCGSRSRTAAPKRRRLQLLPTLWYRNTWSWGCTHEGCEVKPRIEPDGQGGVIARHASLGNFRMLADVAPTGGPPPLLFTENETDSRTALELPEPVALRQGRLSQLRDPRPRRRRQPASTRHESRLAIQAQRARRRRSRHSTAARRRRRIGRQNARRRFRAALSPSALPKPTSSTPPAPTTTSSFRPKSNAWLDRRTPGCSRANSSTTTSSTDWLNGDPDQPTPPPERKDGRNHDWTHIYNRDVISMPDKWEYPWYAAWDLAFHMIPMARVDGEFAKEPAAAFPARMVHAPERPDPGLRVRV